MEKAKADAEKVKLMGAAEATAIENVGRSEAEAMRLKAAAYKLYGEAATLSLVFEALPKVRVTLPIHFLGCSSSFETSSSNVMFNQKNKNIVWWAIHLWFMSGGLCFDHFVKSFSPGFFLQIALPKISVGYYERHPSWDLLFFSS